MEKLIEVSTGELVFSGRTKLGNENFEEESFVITIPSNTFLYTFLKENHGRFFDLRFYESKYNCFLKIDWYLNVDESLEGLRFSCVGGQLVELLDVCESIEQFRDKYDKILYEKA